MFFQPAHHMTAITVTAQGTATVHQGRIQQLTQGGKGAVVTIVWGGSEQKQGITATCQHFGQPTTLGILPIGGSAYIHAMVSFIDNYHIITSPLQLL